MGEGWRQSQPVDQGLGGFAAKRAGCWKPRERRYIGKDSKEAVANLFELLGGVGIEMFNVETGVELVEGVLQQPDAAALQNHGLQVLEGQVGQRGCADLHKRVQVGVVSFAGRELKKECRRVWVGQLGLGVWTLLSAVTSRE